jgi:hypothetical protein
MTAHFSRNHAIDSVLLNLLAQYFVGQRLQTFSEYARVSILALPKNLHCGRFLHICMNTTWPDKAL